ncbi:uro-adherence factor A [Cebidichthys violaceus]|uniref:uro-adherence factor A n=1 Tax=Cebidichthys violaceus TaxID=271503 RepID=UPI0035CBE731
MATKPLAWQEQGPVNSLGEWVKESWEQGKESATISHNPLLQDRKAPTAEPEEDIDVLEPGARGQTLRENQTLSRTEASDATKSENQESATISLCIPKTREMVTELNTQQFEESQAKEKSTCEDAFPPPPLSASSTEECFEKESLSSLEGEVAEIMSDPTEDLTSPDGQSSHEWPPLLSEPVNKEVDASLEEMTTQRNGTELIFLSDGFDYSEPENKMTAAAAAGSNSKAHHSPFDRNNSDEVHTVWSPPFADESEEEEEVSMDIISRQHQWTTLDIRGKPFHPSHLANSSVSNEQDPTSTLPAFLSAKQQEALFPQSQRELAPRGANQEAAQQVLGQSFSPLSTVAMEPSNQGGAGSGCAVAVKERHSRAGDRTEGGSKQTGGAGAQKESGLERNKAVGQQRGGGLLKYSETVETEKVKTEKLSFVSAKHTRMESDSCDDSQSDSGVSADFSPCSTLEGTSTISTVSPTAVLKETPIEREIRRAIEREHSLRRSRGLPNPPTSPEYVEIPLRKTVLCQSVNAKSERNQGKDRQFAGKKMQHEIHEEAEREQDLVKLGKVPGFYDKGTVRQVKDRKQLFEAFQKPSDFTLNVSARSKATSWSSASDISTLETQENISSQASTIGGSYVERIPTPSPSLAKEGGASTRTPRGPGFSEGTACQVIILESNLSVPAQKLCHAKPEAEPVTVVDSGRPNNSSFRRGGHGGIKVREQEEDKDEEEPKENPFFKLRSSTNLIKVEQDIREAQEREKELHKQRVSLYGGTGERVGGGRPVTMLSSSSSLNGLAVPDLPGSSSRGGTRPTAARQSVGKFGMWPPAQAEEERIDRPEVPQSPRTPRQKTPLVQHWESGLVNGHNMEDN